MKQKTLLLFQLLLAVFACYSVLKYSGNLRLLVPLFCLVGMFIVGKVESIVEESQEIKEDKQAKADKGKTTFKPVDCLLKSKNVLLLTDAIHYLLKDLGLAVSRSPDQNSIDRLVRAPDDSLTTFGLKILGDVGDKGGKRRLILIGSNTLREEEDGKPQFTDFSPNTQSLLTSKSIVAMTTLTLYKIYLLCQKKSVDPKVILDLIHRHPGGVFRLEQYMKRSTQAA
jgi:hypothetical protein